MPRVPPVAKTPGKATPKGKADRLSEAVASYSGPPHDPLRQAANLEETGQALVLADLAERQGMDVKDVLGFPDMLASAHLPEKPAAWVVRLAARLNRNAIEAGLWRWNQRLDVPHTAPLPTWAELKDFLARAGTVRNREAPKATPIPTKKLVPLPPVVLDEEPADNPLFDPWS